MAYSAQINLILVVGTACMLMLVIFIIVSMLLHQKKRIKQEMDHRHELIETVIEVQEEERNRIALDLHDEIGSHLSFLKLKVDTLQKNNPAPAPQEPYMEMKTLIDDIVNSTRAFSWELMSPVLKDLGLKKSLENLCTQINSNGALNAEFLMEGEYARQSLKTELSIFRIVQEILTNIVNHAQATKITLVLFCGRACPKDSFRRELELHIDDNGNGFIPKEHPLGQGMGLKSIEARLRLLNATIEYKPGSIKGTEITIKIPEQKV